MPLTPASFGTQSADPASQNGELNSLYAIHRVRMVVGRWWSDGLQNSVFYVFNLGKNQRSSWATLATERLTQQPTESRKFRYHKVLTLLAKTVSLTHCMLFIG